jgi:nucleotide-binding universal stress UspA family protein
MRTVLIDADNDPAMDARIEVAIGLGNALDAHLSFLHVTPIDAYVMMDPFGGSYIMANNIEQLRSDTDTLEKRIATRLNNENIRWDWRVVDGPLGPAFSDPRQLADLIMLSTGGSGFDPMPISEILVRSETPILLTPPTVKAFNPYGPAIVAWNGSREAAHAVRAAVPLLALASSVIIVSIGANPVDSPAEDAAAYLSRTGLKPEVLLIDRQGDVAGIMRGLVEDHAATLLVMGAYGKSRLREAVFGGVTASFIASTSVPILMAH